MTYYHIIFKTHFTATFHIQDKNHHVNRTPVVKTCCEIINVNPYVKFQICRKVVRETERPRLGTKCFESKCLLLHWKTKGCLNSHSLFLAGSECVKHFGTLWLISWNEIFHGRDNTKCDQVKFQEYINLKSPEICLFTSY